MMNNVDVMQDTQQLPDTVLSISVFGRDYDIRCPENKAADLKTLAHNLDAKMREIHRTGRVYGSDRIAVMAALNVAAELLAGVQQQQKKIASIHRVIAAMQSKLGAALGSDWDDVGEVTHRHEQAVKLSKIV